MEHIEERDVAAKLRERFLRILLVKTDIAIAISRRISGVPDFSSIDIESGNGLRAAAFPQIKREQTDAATNIENRFIQSVKKFIGLRKNRIAAQFALHIGTQPPSRKPRRDVRTGRLVPSRFVSLVFHLRRIIALPD